MVVFSMTLRELPLPKNPTTLSVFGLDASIGVGAVGARDRSPIGG